jgi:hypothetical protein
MNIAYQNYNFADWKLAMIEQVNSIITDYKAQGYNLTLRQVYYQFVSRDWLPDRWADKATGSTNNERSYENLGSLISTGRMAGMISWDAIEDRTRELTSNGHWDDPSSIMGAVAQQYAVDKWDDQPYRVEVWVEKDALEGVIARPAKDLDISYFSCRGYTSQTAMHDAAMRLKEYIENGQKVVLLHLGDHDPSGIDMSRDIEDRLSLFLGDLSSEFELRRLALNMDQVRRYAPPPNPAKITDSRATSYIRLHGKSSWELDALEPRVITQLITEQVEKLRSKGLWLARVAEEKHQKLLLKQAAERWDDVAAFLEDEE